MPGGVPEDGRDDWGWRPDEFCRPLDPLVRVDSRDFEWYFNRIRAFVLRKNGSGVEIFCYVTICCCLL